MNQRSTPPVAERPLLTYVFDAHCGWCYGFGPAFASLVAHVGDDAGIRVINGGLFIDERVTALRGLPFVAKANERLVALTGAQLGEAYQRQLAAGDVVIDSERAAAGYIALKTAAPEMEAALTWHVQKAWFRHGRDLSDPATYGEVAEQLGLDGAAVTAAAASAEARSAAREDFARAAALGVHEYPTLLLTVGGTTRRLGDPITKPAELIGLYEDAVRSAAA